MQLFSSPPKHNAIPLAIPQDVPVYRIGESENGSSGFYCDDEFYPEGSVLAFEDTPSVCMEPLNEMALSKMRAHLDRLDAMGKEKAKRDKTNFVSMRQAFERKLSAKSERRSRRLDGEDQKPILGGKRSGPAKARKLTGEDMEEIVLGGLAEKDAVNSINDDPKLGNKAERLNG